MSKLSKAVGKLNLFQKKTGRDKTLSILGGYMMTQLCFVIFIVFVFLVDLEPPMKTFYLVSLFLIEAVFDAYSMLSMRIRVIEEKDE